MILWPLPELPTEQPVLLGDLHVVDARDTPRHQAIGRELPILVAIGAMPGASIIVPFIGEAHRDPVTVMGPQTFDQPIVVLTAPLCRQDGDNCLPPLKEFRPIPPLAALGIGKRYARGISTVPAILGRTDLLPSGFMGERGEGWSRHQEGYFQAKGVANSRRMPPGMKMRKWRVDDPGRIGPGAASTITSGCAVTASHAASSAASSATDSER